MLTAAEWTALVVSLKVAAVALALMVVAGLPLAWLLARRAFPGRTLLDSFLSLPLVLPPVVTGYALLWLLAPTGPAGAMAQRWLGLRLVFTWPAASLAAAVVAFPLFLRTLRSALESVDPGLEEAAGNLGAGPWRTAVRVTFPLAWHGLLAAGLLGFSRALGEFGATILVAGNIPGRTQTVPLAIFSMTQSQQLKDVFPLVLVVSVLAFVMVGVADRLARPLRPAPHESAPTVGEEV